MSGPRSGGRIVGHQRRGPDGDLSGRRCGAGGSCLLLSNQNRTDHLLQKPDNLTCYEQAKSAQIRTGAAPQRRKGRENTMRRCSACPQRILRLCGERENRPGLGQKMLLLRPSNNVSAEGATLPKNRLPRRNHPTRRHPCHPRHNHTCLATSWSFSLTKSVNYRRFATGKATLNDSPLSAAHPAWRNQKNGNYRLSDSLQVPDLRVIDGGPIGSAGESLRPGGTLRS